MSLISEFQSELNNVEEENNYSIDIIAEEIEGVLTIYDTGLSQSIDVLSRYDDTIVVRKSKNESKVGLTPREAAEYIIQDIQT
jgi:hypothetical protein